MHDKTRKNLAERPRCGEAEMHISVQTPGYRLIEPASSIRQVQRPTQKIQGSLLPKVEASNRSTGSFVILCRRIAHIERNKNRVFHICQGLSGEAGRPICCCPTF
jgi:hypothetical protein